MVNNRIVYFHKKRPHKQPSKGLIPGSNDCKCPNCDTLEICEFSACLDGYAWRCRAMVSKNKEKAKKCEIKISIRTGTFFEHSEMQIPQVDK